MTASWPSSLPQSFLVGSYGRKSPDNIISSEMSVGPSKTRRRSSAAPYPLNGAMVLSTAQMAILDDFIVNTIAQRAKAFTFPDPRTGGTLLVRLVDPVSEEESGSDHWKITLNLEVLP